MPAEGFKAAVVTREKASHEDAVKEAKQFKNCPRLLMYGVNGNKVTTVFMAPDEKLWWLNYSQLFPQSKAQTYILNEIFYPEPREIVKTEKPPCGADCTGCQFKEKHGCPGCPATI